MKYQKLTGVVLKKQNYHEADQIVTIWTKEEGKVRVMARGLRSGKSKLAYSMQDLSVVEFETAGNKALPALISAKIIKNFSGLREDLSKAVGAFYGAELMLKMTADEQENIEAYNLIVELLEFLNDADISQQPLFTIVDRFSLRLLKTLGFSLQHAQDSLNFTDKLHEVFTLLMECQYTDIPKLNLDEKIVKQSHKSVKDFIEYILERNLKSERFLLENN